MDMATNTTKLNLARPAQGTIPWDTLINTNFTLIDDEATRIDLVKAPIHSPELTGTPLSVTPTQDDSSTKIATTEFYAGQAGSVAPLMDGLAAVGTSLRHSREDHRHPTDTSLASLESPSFSGVPTAPTPSTVNNSTAIATTAFVKAQGYLTEVTLSGDITGTGLPTISTTLADTGVPAGTYSTVTVDSKGRVLFGSSPTTLAGYGISDAQPLNSSLSAIATLTGTTGVLRKTLADTWELDSTVLTGILVTSPLIATGTTTPTLEIPPASPGVDGFMTGVYATKLEGIAEGATANVGTVTSVSGSGLVNGITLTGNITSSGTLTLGGALTGFAPTTRRINTTLPLTGGGNLSSDLTLTMPAATTLVSGYMTAEQATKLEGVSNNATNYTHPLTHPPSIIAQDSSNLFVTAEEKSIWNTQISSITATPPIYRTTGTSPTISMPPASDGVNGYMTAGYASKLDGISAYARPGTVTSVDTAAATNGVTTSWSNISIAPRLSIGLGEITPTSIETGSGTFSGTVSAPLFDAATLNLGTATASAINLGTAASTQTINIGTGSGATTINIGGAGDTVAIAGTLTTVNTTNTNILDKLVTLNKGGGAASGSATGIEIEENAAITGYLRSSGDRTGFEFKAPATAGVATLTPGSSEVSIWHSGNLSNLNQLTNGPGYITASASITGNAATATHLVMNAVAASTDLNSYTTAGLYHCPANATAATLTNCPTANAFGMLVANASGASQFLWEYPTAATSKYWMRSLYNSTWGPWTRILKEDSSTYAISISGNAATDTTRAAVAQTMYIGTTAVAINRASAALTLAGVDFSDAVTGTSFNSITGLASVAPVIDGTATVGTSTLAARQDHKHPTDTTRAALSGAAFTGQVTIPSAGLKLKDSSTGYYVLTMVNGILTQTYSAT